MTDVIAPPFRQQDQRSSSHAPALRSTPAATRHALGICPFGYALFILVNATLFIRPGEIIPEIKEWPIYLWLIIASVPRVPYRRCSGVLQWEFLQRNAAVYCVILLVPAVFF